MNRPVLKSECEVGEGAAVDSVEATVKETAPALRRVAGAKAQKVMSALSVAGLGFVNPVIRIAAGEEPRPQLADLWRMLGVPLVAVALFLAAWSAGASQVQTSLGQIPGPAAVWTQFDALIDEHAAMRLKEKEFLARQDARNPLIQIFKPVSPLAWLPIVTMIVSALYVNAADAIPKSFLISAITVTLCSLWPTLINTALGVTSIDKDLLNVSKVLQLKTADKIFKLVLPSSLPLIFTGLRLSLGVGWMVLIAAEMLAQNPGLGKFVWDEFQNGSSTSLARIMVAVLTIGVIGFLLDRVMYALQAAFTYSDKR